jgi:hypothetical protein
MHPKRQANHSEDTNLALTELADELGIRSQNYRSKQPKNNQRGAVFLYQLGDGLRNTRLLGGLEEILGDAKIEPTLKVR